MLRLLPGAGLHQSQDAPHWVETVGSRSISYTFVYETREGRMLLRLRSFNAYLRRVHIGPARRGVQPARDAMRAAAIPARKQIDKAVRLVLRS